MVLSSKVKQAHIAPSANPIEVAEAYHRQLIDAHTARYDGTDISTLCVHDFAGYAESRNEIATALAASGKKTQADQIRQGVVDDAISRSERNEGIVFATVLSTVELSERAAELREALAPFESERDRLVTEHDGILEAAQKLGEDEVEELERLTEEMKGLKEQYALLMNDMSPMAEELRDIELQTVTNSQIISANMGEVVVLRLIAANTMLQMEDPRGALDMLLQTVERCHGNSIFGVVEPIFMQVLSNLDVYMSSKLSQGLHQEVSELRELSAEYAIRAAQMIESNLQGKEAGSTLIGLAVQFRRGAAAHKMHNGKMSEIEEILIPPAREYFERGLYSDAFDLISASGDLYMLRAQAAQKMRIRDEYTSLTERAIDIRLGLSEDMEEMLELGEIPETLVGRLLDSVVDERSSAAQMYAALGRFDLAYDMLNAAANAYGAHGYEPQRIKLISSGAEIAQSHVNLFQEAMRTEKLGMGQYL